jgi:hypothetical protein
MTRSERWLRFIETLKIRTRDRRIIRLRFNKPQQMVWLKVKEKIDRGEAIRLIILKARREGVSTEIASWLMAMIASGDLVNAVITAHIARASKRVWKMAQLFVTSSPLLSRFATIGNNQIIVGRSILEIATAGSPESERAGDLTAWLGDEAAFWPHPEAMLATMQTLPPPNVFSIGVIASTPNGRVGDGELFFQEWTRAEEGDSDWLPMFLAWQDFDEHQLPGIAIEEPDTEEQMLRQRFELTDAQLAWRRWKIANDCQGDIDMFHQEFPSSPSEGFVQSGLPFFRAEHLQPLEAHLRKGTRGTIEPDGRFAKTENGYLEIFKFPESGHTYVVGADSSMGLDDKEGGKSHSRSAGEVIDMDTMEQVAEYDAASAPHIMSKHLAGLGRLYHNALIAPEVQSSGGGGGREIIVYLRDLGYWNLHRWKHPDRIQRDSGVLYGWECPSVDSKILTADLRWLEAGQVKIGDRLIGCRENVTGGKGSAIPLRVQTVVHSQVFIAPTIEVTLANGQQTRVSANHPFLAFRLSRKDVGWKWRLASDLKPGDFVKHLPMWEEARTYDAGRLSAFLDGEGHLSRGSRRGGYQLLISQAEGLLADEIGDLWRTLGFEAPFKWVRHKRPHEKPVATVGVLKLVDVLRALGSLRPTRLLRRFENFADAGYFTLRSFPRIEVTSVKAIGDGPVVGLTTDPDHTLIADGIVGHNTNARTRPRMLARIREVVLEKSAVIHSRRLFNQLSAFGEKDSGRMEALAGHDDLLFAYGIALMSRSENYFVMPRTTGEASPLIEPNWQALGLHVKNGLEDPYNRLRRLLALSDRETPEKGFLEL